MALVDDDVCQRSQEPRPLGVCSEQGVVEHVGVGQYVLGVLTGPRPLVAGTVAIMRGDPDACCEAGEVGQLILGERLGR